MSTKIKFLEFSKPFIKALKETFKVMMEVEIKAHSPRVKEDARASGDITAMIGMNGEYGDEGEAKSFKGLIALSWNEETYLKMASKMLMQEYTEFDEDISDTGSEIANIIMGNAKGTLCQQGFKIEMATPTTIRGKEHQIKYPKGTNVIETTISSELGDFYFEICYQDKL